MSLLRTSAPSEDESGFGYYRRLATINALWSWREVAGLANVVPSRSALMGNPEQVAAELGLDVAWTQFASQQEKQCRSWRIWHRVQADAICTLCLAESPDEVPYLRHYWEHTYATACPTHRVRLIDRCSACGEHLSLQRERIEQCACGADLRNMNTTPASPAQVWLASLIASGGRLSHGLALKLRPVEVEALCGLVRNLCLHADPTAAPLPRGAARPKTVQQAVELLASLDALLSDWPKGFEAHVLVRIEHGNANGRTLNTLLGPWYIALKKLCQGNALEPFLRAVVEVAARNFDGVMSLDMAQDMASDATNYLRAAQAAKLIGVSRDRLAKAMQEEECGYRTRRLGTRGVVYEIPKAEVERIARCREEWGSEAWACEEAAIPGAVLTQMVLAGVVTADPHWRNDLFKGGPINRQSLLALTESVIQGVRRHGNPGDARLAWAELTSRRMGDKTAIQAVMKAIAAGEVAAVAKASRLGQIEFLRTDIARYFATPVLESGMSIHQLSMATGWKWESVANWVDLGLLASDQITLRGQPCRVVSPHQLLAFRQMYVPLSDLARAMGTKASALADKLTGVEVVGAKELPNGQRRGGLVRMADLGHLAVLGAQTRLL